MEIRAAAYDDATAVLAWVNDKLIWCLDNPEPYEEKSLAVFAKQWSAIVDQQQVFIIEQDAQAVGHMGWVVQAPEIAEFYIVIGEPQAWGKGLGRAAMELMFQRAAEAGLRALYGRVLGENRRALEFFQSLGFALTGVTENYYQRQQVSYDLHWVTRLLTPDTAITDLLSFQPVNAASL